MTEHYSGHDPATGCGIAIVLGILLWIVLIALIVVSQAWALAGILALAVVAVLALSLYRTRR